MITSSFAIANDGNGRRTRLEDLARSRDKMNEPRDDVDQRTAGEALAQAKGKAQRSLKPRKEGTGRRLEEKSPFAISE